MAHADIQEGKELPIDQTGGRTARLIKSLRSSKIANALLGKQEEAKGERTKLKNGDQLVGDLIYSFPNYFERDD